MARSHLHLLSDSTGETLENIAKAAIGLFENVEAIRHFWPMVRSEVHLDRIMEDIAANPGLVLFTLTNHMLRRRLETRCRALGLHHPDAPEAPRRTPTSAFALLAERAARAAAQQNATVLPAAQVN